MAPDALARVVKLVDTRDLKSRACHSVPHGTDGPLMDRQERMQCRR